MRVSHVPLVVAVLLFVPFTGGKAQTSATGDGSPEAQRRAKCAYLWQEIAPWSYRPWLVEHFIGEHETLGIGPEWYYSMIYGFTQMGLTIGSRSAGLCYGPMDVKWPGMAREVGCTRPDDLRDPRANVAAHCREMAYYHRRTGETGMALLARVFYPASPRYYHPWAPADRRFRALLSGAYAKGKLQP